MIFGLIKNLIMENRAKQTSRKIRIEDQNSLISYFNNQLSITSNRFTPSNVSVKLTQTGFTIIKSKALNN